MNLSGKRIMIVDDIEMGRDVILKLLENSGAVIDSAVNGYDAVKLFTENKYDLVFMDLHMPVMSGYIASRNIRDLPLLWSNIVPIISVSAEDSVELRTKCRESGINDHLKKPFTNKTLFAIIEKWIFSASAPGITVPA